MTSEALRARALSVMGRWSDKYPKANMGLGPFDAWKALVDEFIAEFAALVADARREQIEKDRHILAHGVSLPVVGAAIHELLHTQANGQPAEPFGECSDAHCAEDIVAATSVLGHAIAALRAQEPS